MTHFDNQQWTMPEDYQPKSTARHSQIPYRKILGIMVAAALVIGFIAVFIELYGQQQHIVG